jgi:hypothetical protein
MYLGCVACNTDMLVFVKIYKIFKIIYNLLTVIKTCVCQTNSAVLVPWGSTV